MKKRGMGLFIALGGIALVLIIASIFFIVSSSYTARLVLVNDGYFVGDQVHDCLFAADEDAVVTSIPAISASQSDVLFEKSGKYYIGDDYTPVSLNFPYVINNGSAVMFTSSVDKLITGTFEYVDSYENLYMSGGVTFNADMERAYREDFILVDAGNGLYMNADKLTVGGSLTTSGEIPANSFIRFMENEITYYFHENDALSFARIAPVSRTATITIGGYSYTYIEFLEKLGLYTERKVREKVTPTPSPAPTEDKDEEETTEEERKVYNFGDPNYTPAEETEETEETNENVERDDNKSSSNEVSQSTETTVTETSEGEGERDEDEEREMLTPDPGQKPTRAPRPTRVPSVPEPADEPLPAEDDGERITPTRKPTATPMPTPTLMPAVATADGTDPSVPAPAAAAPPAAPAAAVEPNPGVPMPDNTPRGSATRPVRIEDWEKPEVSVGDIVPGVFTIFLDNFFVSHSKYIDSRYGIEFHVKNLSTGKIFVKSVMGGGPVRLAAPFTPETEYQIEIIMHYVNRYGESVEEEVLQYDDIYKTKSRDALDRLDLTMEKGGKEPDFFHLLNMSVGIAVQNASLENPRYIEALEYLSRFEFTAVNKNDDKDVRVFTLGSTDLRNLKSGVVIADYKSSKVFRNNSQYKYSISAYDRDGVKLVLIQDGKETTEYVGEFKTCSQVPKTSFSVRNNRISDYSVAIRINNSGNAEVKNIKFRVSPKGDNPEDNTDYYTTIQYLVTGDDGKPYYTHEETAFEHLIPEEMLEGLYDAQAGSAGFGQDRFVEIVVKFSSLDDQTVYILDVEGDCDIYAIDLEECESEEDWENRRWRHEVLGSSKFTTASISSLGNLYLDNRIPTENENLEEGVLYMTLSMGERTDDLLVKLLDSIDLRFMKNKKDDEGNDTGEYVLDEDAEISYMFVDMGSTNFSDAQSVLSEKRPNNLGLWKDQATAAAQREYDQIINDTKHFEDTLNGLIERAGKEPVYSEPETIIDENGQEVVISNPISYGAYKEEYENAKAALETGNYNANNPEYIVFSKAIKVFEELEISLREEATMTVRKEAEDKYTEVYMQEMENSSSGQSLGYVTKNLLFVEGPESDNMVSLDDFRERTPESLDPNVASDGAIQYKYAKELRIAVTGLQTDTMYKIEVDGYATAGSNTSKIARTVLTMSTFRTYKKRATVSMDAYYAGSTFVSLFGLSINDPDNAISEYPVDVTFTDSLGQIMGTRVFTDKNTTFDEMRFSSLTKNETYYLTFLATTYNKGWTKSSAEINKEIYVNKLTETFSVVTHESIIASINLLGINEAYDLVDEVRVLADTSNKYIKNVKGINDAGTAWVNVLRKGLTYTSATNGSQYFEGMYKQVTYDLTYDFGNERYNVIEPCIWPYYNRYTKYIIYDENMNQLSYDDDENAKVVVSYGDGSASSLKRGYWTSNYIRLNRNLTGPTTLHIKAVAINGVNSGTSKGVYPLIGFSFHRFGEVGEAAYTANIRASIEDEFGQLNNGSISSYIIRVYEKEGEATSEETGYRLLSERVHVWSTKDDYNGEGDNCDLKMYSKSQWDAFGEKGAPDFGQKTFYGTDNTINTDFGINVNWNKYYRVELWVMINNYALRLGTSGFTSDRLIHGIESEDDLLDAYCHPSDSYIVMNDIRTSKVNIFATRQFNGVIDFNGHKITHMANNYLIYRLGAYGEIRNVVYEKGNGSVTNYKDQHGLIYENYGTLSGVRVIYNNGLTDYKSAGQYVRGLMVYNNQPTALIENFVIELKKDIWFYNSEGVSLGVYLNYGMIRNGYACATADEDESYENSDPQVYTTELKKEKNGYPAIYQIAKLETLKEIISTETTAKTRYTENYYTGGIVRINRDGIMENIYSLVDMYLRNNDAGTKYRMGASVCGMNEGYVRNCFSAAKVMTLNESVTPKVFEGKPGRAPSVQNFVEGVNSYGHSSNIYHYDMGLSYGECKDTQGRLDSIPIRKELLYDHNWYEALFDDSGSTMPGQWDYEMLSRSCYPHVLQASSMPEQPQIKLPALTQTSSEITPLAAHVTQQNDYNAYCTFTFYNPNGFLIRSLNVEYLVANPITQWTEGKFYYVRAELKNPLKYYSNYHLISFDYSGSNGSGRQSRDLNENKLDVNAEFYKFIYDVEGFAEISKGLDQNYKLGDNIDFSGYDASQYAVGQRNAQGALTTVYNAEDNANCFTGQFDGNNYTVSNIDVGNTGFLFGKVACPIRNLRVENIHTPSTENYGAQKSRAQYMGLVAVFRLGGSLTNVHVRGAHFENINRYGGVLLARNFYENEISNCSVQDAYLETGMPIENATAASVGGLVGHNDLGLIIHNCYIDGFEINAESAGDVYGVGGLVGYTVNGIEIKNVYAVNGRINTNYSNTGGLVGSVQSINDVTNSSKTSYYTNEYFISNFYEDVEIITMANNIGGVIGYTSKLSGVDWVDGVNFGAIVSKSNSVDSKTLNPIVGYYTSATASDIEKGLSGLRLGKHDYIYNAYQLDGVEYPQTDLATKDDKPETEESRLAHFKTIDYSTLTNESTYGFQGALIRPVLAWRDDFNIDGDKLAQGIMPTLYYTDDVLNDDGTRKELPDQKGFSLKPDEVEIKSAYLENKGDDNGNTTFVPRVIVEISHDESVKSDTMDLEFEGCEWGEKENHEKDFTRVRMIDNNNKVIGTRIAGSLKIFEGVNGSEVPYARDKFFLTKIKYQSGVASGSSVVYVDKEKKVYRDIGIKSRWITIRDVDEWNRLMSSNNLGYGQKGYNIILAPNNPDGILDFGNRAVESRVKVNHIIGWRKQDQQNIGIQLDTMEGEYNPNCQVIIKNLFLYTDDLNTGNSNCFIEQATGHVIGLKFQDCMVSQTYTGAVTRSQVSNKTCLIGSVSGNIDNVSFEGIDILAFASANIAPVALAYGTSTNIKVKDVNIVQMKRNSTSYLSTYSVRSGYVAFLGKFAGVNGVDSRRVYIDVGGAYVGGVVGRQVGGCYIWNCNVEDIMITNRTNSGYNGGIVGAAVDRGTRQRVGMLHADRVYVQGGTYTGGLMGWGYIGGWDMDAYRRAGTDGVKAGQAMTVAGATNKVQNDMDRGTNYSDSIRSWVKHGMVMTWTTSQFVGGAVGRGSVWKTDVENSWVFGATYCGGVVGGFGAIDSKAKNVFVSHMGEKIQGERLGTYDDPWPSVFYRLAPDDNDDLYRELIPDFFGARTTSSNYWAKAENNAYFLSNHNVPQKSTGKQYDTYQYVRTYLRAEHPNNATFKAAYEAKYPGRTYDYNVALHEEEQKLARGEFITWRNDVYAGTRGLETPDERDKSETFWTEGTWSITSYTENLEKNDWTHGRSGITIGKLSNMIEAATGIDSSLKTDNDQKRGGINLWKNAQGTSINDYMAPTRLMVFSSYSCNNYPDDSNIFTYVGGVMGYNYGARSVACENTVVYAPRSKYVGGISGRTCAHNSAYATNYGIQNAIVKGSTIIGGIYAGGLTGEIIRDNYNYIEVDGNTYVEARAYGSLANGRNTRVISTGECAGGIAGRIYMGSTTLSEHPQLKYILSGATVVAKTYAGGIAGKYDQGFYTNTSDIGWMMLGQVYVWDGNGGTGSIMVTPITSGATNSYKTGAVLKTSTLNYKNCGSEPENVPINTKFYKGDKSDLLTTGWTRKETGDDYFIRTNEKLSAGYPKLKSITVEDLKNKSTYTGIEWPDYINEITYSTIVNKTKINGTVYDYNSFLTRRFKYDLTTGTGGKLPYFTLAGSIQYGNTEQNINNAKETMFRGDPLYLEISSIAGGSIDTSNNSGLGLVRMDGAPTASIYASDTDAINIDFSCVDPSYTWTLAIGDEILSGAVSDRTLSFTYDFAADLTLVVCGEDYEKIYTASGADLAHYVDVAGGTYYFITEDGIASGTGSSALPTKYGSFRNLFGGKALERDGSIINLVTGEVIQKTQRNAENGQSRQPVPLASGIVSGYKVDTYSTYSVTTEISSGEKTVRDGFLFFTDGKSLQSIKTADAMRADGVILYSELDTTYFAALGKDRTLNVLLDNAFRTPEGMKLDGIVEMSNSRNISAPYCVVMYGNGGLLVFNFVTGQTLLSIEAPVGTNTEGGTASSDSRAISFAKASELADALNEGAYDLNGIVSSPISRSSGKATDLIDGDPVDGGVLGGVDEGILTEKGTAVMGTSTEEGDTYADGEEVALDETVGGGVAQEEDESVPDEMIGQQLNGDPIPEGTEIGSEPSGAAVLGSNDSERAELGDTSTEDPGAGNDPDASGNTINGTGDVSGEGPGPDAPEGVVSTPVEGAANEATGLLPTLAGQESTVGAEVESVIEELSEDGSLPVEVLVEELGVSESEAIMALSQLAMTSIEKDELTVDDAVRVAFKTLMSSEDITDEMMPVETAGDFAAEFTGAFGSRMIGQDGLTTDYPGLKTTLSEESPIDPATLKLVPVYNPETGEYELFEMNELLTGKEEPKSIEERLAENGKFLNTAHGYVTGKEDTKASRDYRGFIAVLIAVLLAGGLTWAMIYKKRKEGSR